MKSQLKSQLRFMLFGAILLIVWACPTASHGRAITPPPVSAKDRCQVCGMFVQKYPQWIATLMLDSGKFLFFDGVKDLMVYRLNPGQYGLDSAEHIVAVRVKDYYTLNWIDGRTAWYVIGSDVYGPMGNEFIPFASQEGARAFLKDHHGRKVITLEDITEPLVESMRGGGRMR